MKEDFQDQQVWNKFISTRSEEGRIRYFLCHSTCWIEESWRLNCRRRNGRIHPEDWIRGKTQAAGSIWPSKAQLTPAKNDRYPLLDLGIPLQIFCFGTHLQTLIKEDIKSSQAYGLAASTCADYTKYHQVRPIKTTDKPHKPNIKVSKTSCQQHHTASGLLSYYQGCNAGCCHLRMNPAVAQKRGDIFHRAQNSRPWVYWPL